MVGINQKLNWIGLILVLAMFTACGSKKSALTISDNYQLVYNLSGVGTPYNFIVDVIDREPDLVFDYKMTNSSETSGRIFMTQGDLDTARGQNNYFRGGQRSLKKQTTIWISKRNYAELKNNGSTVFFFPQMFGSKKEEYKYDGEEKYGVSINGKAKTVTTFIARSTQNDAHFMRILDNAGDPFILEMEMDFKIELKEINFVD